MQLEGSAVVGQCSAISSHQPSEAQSAAPLIPSDATEQPQDAASTLALLLHLIKMYLPNLFVEKIL